MDNFESLVAAGDIVVVDTIATLRPGQVGGGGTNASSKNAGSVIIAASHAGLWTGYCAAKIPVRGAIQNDAGVGLDGAGIASLSYLDKLGVPAASAAHTSCCIGDKKDIAANGIISHVNVAAASLGCKPGESVQNCAIKMCGAPMQDFSVPPYSEARSMRWAIPDRLPIWILDSLSLIQEGDEGSIVVSASHGGLFNGKKDGFVPAGIEAVTIADAGVGKNRAGIARLATLDELAMMAVAVSVESARIGSGQSVWETGRISFCNDHASASGIRPGLSVQDYVQAVAEIWLAKQARK